ncbi:MAG: hypothetical protein V1913_11640 [Fibrobacterota bacterium]
MNDNSKRPAETPLPPTPITGLILSLFWIIIGNASLMLIAYSIAFRKGIITGLYVALFILNVLALAAARYLDIRFYNGTTTNGEPATLIHWIKYAKTLGIIAGILLLSTVMARNLFGA